MGSFVRTAIREEERRGGREENRTKNSGKFCFFFFFFLFFSSLLFFPITLEERTKIENKTFPGWLLISSKEVNRKVFWNLDSGGSKTMMWLIWKIIRLISTRSFYILDDFYFFFFFGFIREDFEGCWIEFFNESFSSFWKF